VVFVEGLDGHDVAWLGESCHPERCAPLNIHTIETYLQTQHLSIAGVEPLSRDFYLNYAQWFQQQKRIEPLSAVGATTKLFT
jgi:hypothetical protein